MPGSAQARCKCLCNRTELLQLGERTVSAQELASTTGQILLTRETVPHVRPVYIAVIPPSTNSNEPVTYDASSDARKRMQAATSSALSGRLSIVRLAASSLYWVTVWPAA